MDAHPGHTAGISWVGAPGVYELGFNLFGLTDQVTEAKAFPDCEAYPPSSTTNELRTSIPFLSGNERITLQTPRSPR